MFLKQSFKTLVLATACLSLASCKTGYNRLYTNSEPDANAPPCAENLITSSDEKTIAVFDLISDLTCKMIKNYVLSGQSLGDGNQIVSSDENKNYDSLIGKIQSSENKRIAIASIDYEKTKQYNADELKDANKQLIKHANEYGGIVSISWTPFNPWKVNSAPANPLAYSSEVTLSNLYDTTDNELAGKKEFNERLNLIIEKLKELNNSSVPVLFSPYPEMNTTAMWYGPRDNNELDTEFNKLWNYTIDKVKANGLKNIIWVYAPRSGASSQRVAAKWGYPGGNAVDVVAPICFSDALSISNFDDYKKLNKPLGMTRFGPITADGSFDNTMYQTEWADQYAYLAYWIADHDDGQNKESRSIYRNQNFAELMKNSTIATTETIKEKEWLKLK